MAHGAAGRVAGRVAGGHGGVGCPVGCLVGCPVGCLMGRRVAHGVAVRAGPLDGRLASRARVDLIYVRTHLGPPPILDRPPRIYPEKS